MVPDRFEVNQNIRFFLTVVSAAVKDMKVKKVPLLSAAWGLLEQYFKLLKIIARVQFCDCQSWNGYQLCAVGITSVDSERDLAPEDFLSVPFTPSREWALPPHLPLAVALGTLEVSWFWPVPLLYLNKRCYEGLGACIMEALGHAAKP